MISSVQDFFKMRRILIIILSFIIASSISGQDYSVFDFDITAFESCEVTNFKLVNTKRHEFAPVLFGDGIAYVTELKEKKDGKTGTYFDLKFTHFTKDINIPFSEQIHSNGHLGPIAFTSDQRVVYYTKNEESKKGKDGKYHMKLHRSSYSRREWKPKTPFRYNSDDYSILHPSISSNGKILIFSSNMPGGLGGYDLYMCHASGRGWKKPINLGPNVNSEKNEVFPFIYENHWVIYASDGKEGYGALDLYISDNLDEEWSYGENLGPTLNTEADDFSLIIDPTSSTGYYASSRKGGKGKDDIYKINFSEPIIKRKEDVFGTTASTKQDSSSAKYVELSIHILNESNKTPLEDVKIIFEAVSDDKKITYQTNIKKSENQKTVISIEETTGDKSHPSISTDKNGQIQVTLLKGHKYIIQMIKEGFSKGQLTLDTESFIPQLSLFLSPE